MTVMQKAAFWWMGLRKGLPTLNEKALPTYCMEMVKNIVYPSRKATVPAWQGAVFLIGFGALYHVWDMT